MKIKLLLFIFFLSLTSFAQTNLVPNGNFELWSSSTQLDNWYRFPSGLISLSTTAQNGGLSANLEISTGTFNYFNSEYFAVEAGKTYRVTLYHKVESGSFTSLDFSLYNKPGTFKQEIIKKTDATFSTSEWRKVEFDYTSPTSQNIEVDVWVNGATNSQILIDNVSMVSLPPPEPQYTLIPDLYFEQALISFGIDSGVEDGKVLTSSLATVTSLNVSSRLITNLKGIEDFINLTSLKCDNNKLVSLDLSNNIQLKNLECRQASLTSLDLSKNVKLQTLECFENSLTSLDFSTNPELTRVDCSNNPITSINLSKNSSLDYLKVSTVNLASLDISNNIQLKQLLCSGYLANTSTPTTGSLTSLDVRQNKVLTQIDCSNNLITNLDLSQNKDLKYVDCSRNKLADLNVSNNTLLESLICTQNKIPTLDISNNTLLKSVWCAANQLTSLNTSKNTSLNSIECLSNQITSLDLSQNKNLTELRCNANRLENLDLSQNPALLLVWCQKNNLSSLNLKNGKNNLLSGPNLIIWDNPNLKCVKVDDVAYSNANWSRKDSFTQYNIDCTPYTAIPDINFEKKLIALGIDSGATDGRVLTENIKTITDLDVSKSNITDLSGIQDFTSLIFLNCANNAITNLDLSSNLALENVQTQNNQLINLNVSKNTSLTILACYNNKLTNLNVSTLASLKKLATNTNNITVLNVDNNIALTDLNCGGNKIETINVSKNTNLINFYCHNNLISSLDISSNLQLENFICDDNKLTTLDVSNNPKMEMLDCLNNKITRLDISKNPKITELACQNNQLRYLNLKNGGNTNLDLTYSDFSNNPDLKCIEVDDVDYATANWSNIKDATAQFNIDCTPYTLIPDSNFEDKLIALKIDKDGKNGKVATSSISQITLLDVADSNISDLTGLEDFTSLIYFFCDRNKITTVDLSKNLLLENIGVRENNLTSLNVSANTKIHTLDFAYNQITTIDLSQNINLKRLGFDNNKLTEINLTNNKELTSLNGSKNELISIDLSQHKKLEAVYLNNNQLVTVNLKNGNNVLIPGQQSSLDLTFNSKLKCILVDDVDYSNANWSTSKDVTASYNTDCTPYTLIPDVNFEKKLIDLGIDNDGLNGKVLLGNISNVISLNVANSNISDLTGIQDFTSLKYFSCNHNNLNSINVSNNKALEFLEVHENMLTNLDVTANINLRNLNCSQNQLTSLDLSQNTALTGVSLNFNQLTSIDVRNNPKLENFQFRGNKLTSLDISNQPNLVLLACSQNKIASLDLKANKKLEELYCDFMELTSLDVSENKELINLSAIENHITALDVSQNPKIVILYIEFNPLKSLNVKNGNNKNFILPTITGKTTSSSLYTSFLGTSSLNCIKVDDVAYSNQNWSKIKETTTNYSETCTLGLEDSVFAKATIYPNPTKGEITIQNVSVEKVTVYDTNGKLVRSFQLNSNESNNQIDLSGLPRGVYYLYLINQDAASAKKIVVE